MTAAARLLAINGGRPVRTVKLPLHRPTFDRAELCAVERVLGSTHVAGDGPVGRQLEALIGEKFGARRVLLVNSCTAALEMAVMAAGIGPGDEVVMPSYTFVSTANAVVRCGATPVFADIDPRTANVDPDAVEAAVNGRTRAIMVVHYAGMACEMERISEVAERHGLLLLEDAAHAMNAWYRGRALSTLGVMGCLSFHETKDLVCGEGGALVIHDDDSYAGVAEVIREKGTDRSAFLRGERRKYAWVGLGSSYVMSEVLAAIALEQFKKLDGIRDRKSAHACELLERLAPYGPYITLPAVPDGCTPSWHLFAIRAPIELRDWMLRAFAAEGIGAAFHYVPLHSAPFARASAQIRRVELPNTDHVAATLVRLPLFASMTDADVDDVVTAVDKVVSAIAADA